MTHNRAATHALRGNAWRRGACGGAAASWRIETSNKRRAHHRRDIVKNRRHHQATARTRVNAKIKQRQTHRRGVRATYWRKKVDVACRVRVTRQRGENAAANAGSAYTRAGGAKDNNGIARTRLLCRHARQTLALSTPVPAFALHRYTRTRMTHARKAQHYAALLRACIFDDEPLT